MPDRFPPGVKPSPLYLQCLADARAHHLSSKTFSGKFLRPHAPSIKEIIDRLGCDSILDYGCGKGSQYEWVSHDGDASIPEGQTLETYWRCGVFKYDPAWPPFQHPPPVMETFDLVICTHALGSIPITDLDWVVDELIRRANKAVYIAEKIGPVGKQVFSEPDKMPRWDAGTWARFIGRRPHRGIEITLATRQQVSDTGVISTRVKL